ncbi:hypothetical protein PV703_04625 [Streptomyces sp. ME01-24h]|nr:hypothetical protein [Streptomyces sp. ME19-03-3]MDX3352621.1 hypothetical protein [Streptomyces sp. ME01-24h]
MAHDTSPEDARGTPPPEDRRERRQAPGRDPDAAAREGERPDREVPEAPRDVAPQEPPD